MQMKQNKDICGMLVLSVLFIAVLIMQGGCTNSQKGSSSDTSKSPGATPTPTATPTSSSTPTATPTATPTPPAVGSYYMKVNAAANSSLIYAPFHLVNADPTDWSGDCRVDVTLANNTVPKDIQCYLEIGELDLWMTDITLNWEAPVANCPYFRENSYWFWQYKPGVGPATMEYDVSTSGAISWTTAAPAGAHIEMVNGASQIVCDYNYSNNKPIVGPNCCTGSYTATIHTADGSGGYTTTVASADWGGQWGNCAGGPATYDTKFARSVYTNEPLPLITWAGGGLSGTSELKSPGSRRNNMDMSIANYYSASPKDALEYAVAAGHVPHPYYEFMCLDGAYAVMGRIRVSVRKWNLMSELGKNGNGDPTLTDPNINGFPAPYRLYNSWEELGNNYPGGNL